jgi:hypothetical protein
MLRNHFWHTPALVPTMPHIDKKSPKKPRKLAKVMTSDGYKLFWTAPRGKGWKKEARQYVVYRFAKGEKVDLDDVSKIVTVTPNNFCSLPVAGETGEWTYVVTALNRMQVESKGAKIKIR